LSIVAAVDVTVLDNISSECDTVIAGTVDREISGVSMSAKSRFDLPEMNLTRAVINDNPRYLMCQHWFAVPGIVRLGAVALECNA
jgi:hypothetical protein